MSYTKNKATPEERKAKAAAKKLEKQAAQLCQNALGESQAQINILDMGKLMRLATTCLTDGYTHERTRLALHEWIGVNRVDTSIAIFVELRAFPVGSHVEGKLTAEALATIPERRVVIPMDIWRKAENVEQKLELVFHFGQNDTQNVPGCYSVSMGDVVRMPDTTRYRVDGVGFTKLGPEGVS